VISRYEGLLEAHGAKVLAVGVVGAARSFVVGIFLGPEDALDVPSG
jgi:hypothetical protein